MFGLLQRMASHTTATWNRRHMCLKATDSCTRTTQVCFMWFLLLHFTSGCSSQGFSWSPSNRYLNSSKLASTRLCNNHIYYLILYMVNEWEKVGMTHLYGRYWRGHLISLQRTYLGAQWRACNIWRTVALSGRWQTELPAFKQLSMTSESCDSQDFYAGPHQTHLRTQPLLGLANICFSLFSLYPVVNSAYPWHQNIATKLILWKHLFSRVSG